MKIKILHLYYDIMNLYGDYGNISLVSKALAEKGIEVIVDKKTVTDEIINFTEYDFIYCGAGTESKRDFCLEHLRKFGDSLSSAFSSEKVMLFTGNSYEMLGKSITTINGDKKEGIGIFDFTVTEQNKRLTGDVTFTADFSDEVMVGFINKCSLTEGITSPLFRLTTVPEAFKSTTEGIKDKNFFGTQVIGPVAVKNPQFLNHLTTLIINSIKE